MTDDQQPDVVDEQAEAIIRGERLRRALTEAPGLAEHLRAIVMHSDGRTEPGAWHTAERTPLLTETTDNADGLFAGLLAWVDFFARELDIKPPMVARTWITRGGIRRSTADQAAGFSAGTTPEQASAQVWALAFWLLEHDAAIAAHPEAATYQDGVATYIWTQRSRARLTAAPVRGGRSRLCPLDCVAATNLNEQLEVAGVTKKDWKAHRGNEQWRREHFPHHFTVHGEFFGGTFDGALKRGARLSAYALGKPSGAEETEEEAMNAFFDAIAGVEVRCSNCGWKAPAKASQIAKWLA